MALGESEGGNGTNIVRYTFFRHAYVFFRIFILEGILTVLVSLSAFFLVPTWSQKAKFVRPPLIVHRSFTYIIV